MCLKYESPGGHQFEPNQITNSLLAFVHVAGPKSNSSKLLLTTLVELYELSWCCGLGLEALLFVISTAMSLLLKQSISEIKVNLHMPIAAAKA